MLLPLLLIFSGYTVPDFAISLQTQMDSEALYTGTTMAGGYAWYLFAPNFLLPIFQVPFFFSLELACALHQNESRGHK